MKILMLRGEIPTDRDPQEIVFENIEEVDDVWSQLIWAMTHEEDELELWYWGGEREHKFAPNFTERWVPSFHTYGNSFTPDVIFCRGGFQEYHVVLSRFPNAFSVYYGAGRRFLPQPGFNDYDIVLQDSPEQVEICKQKFPNLRVELFIKPAADNIFYPHDVEKEYDVCFPANGSQAGLKGHLFVYNTAPKDLKILNLGNKSKYKTPNNVTSYRVLRSQMAEHMSKCKVGIVTVSGDVDSCPRIIPELLACGLPIVVSDGTRFWAYKYIESAYSSRYPYASGETVNKDSFWNAVRFVLENLDYYKPRKYYENYLSLEKAADYIRGMIDENSF